MSDLLQPTLRTRPKASFNEAELRAWAKREGAACIRAIVKESKAKEESIPQERRIRLITR